MMTGTADIEHWISRFLLQPQLQPQFQPQLQSQPLATSTNAPPNAAVLLPVFRQHGDWTLVMTRRALHLRHHPGQISFPGGRIEVGESTAQAALRETYEEIGIPASAVQLLGSLPAINTSTGFIVQPWLGLLNTQPVFSVHPDEVDSVLLLPLREALCAQRRKTEIWQLRGRQQQLHFIPWQQQLIWGASAEVLYQLAGQVAGPAR